jgi:hypothetical protein
VKILASNKLEGRRDFATTARERFGAGRHFNLADDAAEIATIRCDDALMLRQRANLAGWYFREPQALQCRPLGIAA